MPAIARLRTYGMHAHRDHDRLVDCLRNREPFYMASMTGGPITPDMLPSVGQLDRETAASILRASRVGLVDYIVWSYETPIAYRLTGSCWQVPDRRYSRTTTRHQHLIRMAVSTLGG